MSSVAKLEIYDDQTVYEPSPATGRAYGLIGGFFMVKEYQGCVLRKSIKIKNEIDICDRCLYFGSKGCKKKDNEKKKDPRA